MPVMVMVSLMGSEAKEGTKVFGSLLSNNEVEWVTKHAMNGGWLAKSHSFESSYEFLI
jgi:hypothetical protein